jgi:hypothetical protein
MQLQCVQYTGTILYGAQECLKISILCYIMNNMSYCKFMKALLVGTKISTLMYCKGDVQRN